MREETGQKVAYLICFVVFAIAVTGYFVGLQSPMNPAARYAVQQPSSSTSNLKTENENQKNDNQPLEIGTLAATHYANMDQVAQQRSAIFRTSIAGLKPTFDMMAEVDISPEQKLEALAIREKNRSFNGAPPTIPHVIDQMSANSCMACHGQGFKSETLRISKMSHQFLTNCTQCHIESGPSTVSVSQFKENGFVGLPAPTGGSRAFPGAPPTIPHSTWMRVNCMSCHGFATEQGIRSTHPWQKNCQQCHVPSSELDQTLLDAKPKFLSPPKINRRKSIVDPRN